MTIPFKPNGEQIRAARVAKKMTMHQTAKAIGIKAQTLSFVEHDRTVLKDEEYTKLIELLEIRPRPRWRACEGVGADYDKAVERALAKRRDEGFDDAETRLVVHRHFIVPYRHSHDMFGTRYGHHHHVLLRKETDR